MARCRSINSDNNAAHRWRAGWVECFFCGARWVSVRPAAMIDFVFCWRCLDFTGLTFVSLERAARRTH
jgi:hypothetical protein